MPLTFAQRHYALHLLLVAGFLFGLHFYLPMYITSSFLEQITTEQGVGILYALGSIAAIGGLWATPALLMRHGAYRVIISAIGIAALTLLGLAYFTQPILIVLLFLVFTILIRVIGITLDEFVEHYSVDKETGSVRGSFLTAQSVALVMAPLIAGFIVGDNQYWKIFLVSAVVLIPLLALFSLRFRNFKDPEYTHIRLYETLKRLEVLPNVKRAIMANLVLRLFYSWMVIYTPLYLHRSIGLPWESIGIIFTVMLLPFALLEYPLGKLADTRFGEKEILTLGFIIIAVSTALLSFVTTTSVVVWALLLLVTRIGASAVEIMSETYFFKHTDDHQSSLLSVFRMVGPVAYIIAPLIASVALFFVDTRYLFLIFGIVVLWGLRYSLALKDTL